MIEPDPFEEFDVSLRTLALLGGIVLLAIHFYRLSVRVSRRRDGHQETEPPSELPPYETERTRPRVRAISAPTDEVPTR